MIIGLLLIALACLVLGLATSGALWFVASVLASAGAGCLLVRLRSATRARRAAPAHSVPAHSPPAPPELAQPELAQPEPAQPEPAQPEPAQPEPAQPEPAQPEPAQPEPAQPEPAPPEPAQPEPAQPEPAQPEPAQPEPAQPEPVAGEVWVIDGRPRYHLADCAIIAGQNAEPIPFEQADEDGFMPCSLCEPSTTHTSNA
jgi:outer membrane biosynthesis protein TonB